jgi:hypothetical protein
MKHVILAAAVVFAAARCATMVNDTTEKIPVRSTPAGAVVSVDCGNAPLYGGVTPTTITVPRVATPCNITLAKEGYLPARIDFQRQLSGAANVNKAVAAPVGAAAALIGFLVADHIAGLNPDAIAGSVYAGTTALASAPANAFDARKGGAYKQVPGEVDVTLEPEPTTPSPPR